MRFLIDECLAIALADMAAETGHAGSAHVSRRGMSGWSDAGLMTRVLDGDWTLVTRNSDDFRPPPGSSSRRPHYAGLALHAGLVCLNLPPGAREPEHRSYFRAALGSLADPDDLTNEILEVWPDGDGVRIDRYRFPPDEA